MDRGNAEFSQDGSDGGSMSASFGDVAHKGIYVGVSPMSGKPLYAAPDSGKLCVRWSQVSRRFIEGDHYKAHDGWRLPTAAEAKMLATKDLAGGNVPGVPARIVWAQGGDQFFWNKPPSVADRNWDNKGFANLCLVCD